MKRGSISDKAGIMPFRPALRCMITGNFVSTDIAGRNVKLNTASIYIRIF